MRKSELPISDPCAEDWGTMRRDPGARRFCDQCSKHVHDLTSLTEDEAREVLAQAAGARICVRYRVDGSGTLKFCERAQSARSEPALVPLRRRPTPAAPRVAAVAAAPAVALAFALAACTPHGEAEQPEAIEVADPAEHVLMGDVMPVEIGDESGGEEQPCDPEATDPEEVELMGDVAWDPELETETKPQTETETKPQTKPETEPEPTREVIMGRIQPHR